MEKIRNRIINSKQRKTFAIPFEEKSSERFHIYINNLYSKNQSPIYIWTELGNDCGIYEINSILEFNFNFPFKVNSEGIIVLLAKNFQNKITLDFSENYNEQFIEIEILGENWNEIEY
ncbi:hypothetical protein EHQ83_05470 [Leptospira yasudae]|uniref:Uncharacterized protein n=2 Tax=Leptospira yasudae TaxID=2202201 RepID=A0A6N4QTS6_9LEPT|nr:hypothetical protein EHQ72_20000 [Leptospira yasudae]TGL76625.1 hypothetical protein EHQ77_18230 [Leptospira yasudae]TGL86966.1 hypothetical protein EHQ83_05470 [Leptospira yasudae]